MPLHCRLIIDPPANGPHNMAVDEALLESAAGGGPPTLRIYRWSEPTLSLGYFQSYADRSGHPPSAELPCVRRTSGGGALVHHHEVTYSLAMPPTALAGADTRGLYCEAHRAVIEAVAAFGGNPASMSLCEPAGPPAADGEEFLCFLRRADADLLVEPAAGVPISAPGVRGRYKVGGSAQRKRRGALLQHGGVLLRQSPQAPELPGLAELGIAAMDDAPLAEELARKFSERFDLRLDTGVLTTAEAGDSRRIRAEKYDNQDWTRRR